MLLLGCSSAWAAPTNTRPQLSTTEKHALRIVQQWAHGRNRHFQVDARLTRAARQSLGAVPPAPGYGFDLEPIRQRAQRLGWTDGQLAAIALRVAPQHFATTLRRELESRLAAVRSNRVGIAVTRVAGAEVALILLAKRWVYLQELPSRVSQNDTVQVRGEVVVQAHEHPRLFAVLRYPNGSLQKQRLTLNKRKFEHVVHVGTTAGILTVQLLIERGLGPEIAASWPIGVGVPPWDTAPVSDLDLATTTLEAAEQGLAARLLLLRETQGLPLPMSDPRLADAARQHADDMLATKFFAHWSPTTGQPTDRLAQRGVAYERVLENIAVGESIDGIMEQWLNSPAHRKNLLEADVDAFGIGVAVAPPAARAALGKHVPRIGRPIYATLVLARFVAAPLPNPTGKARARAH